MFIDSKGRKTKPPFGGNRKSVHRPGGPSGGPISMRTCVCGCGLILRPTATVKLGIENGNSEDSRKSITPMMHGARSESRDAYLQKCMNSMAVFIDGCGASAC